MWSPAVAVSPSLLRDEELHLGLNWGFAAPVAADPDLLLLKSWEGISDCGITGEKGGS